MAPGLGCDGERLDQECEAWLLEKAKSFRAELHSRALTLAGFDCVLYTMPESFTVPDAELVLEVRMPTHRQFYSLELGFGGSAVMCRWMLEAAGGWCHLNFGTIADFSEEAFLEKAEQLLRGTKLPF